jgi:transcriptional regulator with XRE-family HTH domain
MSAQTVSTKTKKRMKKKPPAEAGLDTVGARIITARRVYNITQVQLAERLAVTRAAISQYEQDKNRPRPHVIDRLAEVFNADPEWFDRGRGKAPKRSDVPVTVAEVALDGINSHVTDLRNLRIGFDWRVPMRAFELPVSAEHIIVFKATNRAATILPGDWVLVDTERLVGPSTAVFLVQSLAAPSPHLRRGNPPGSQILGRVVAYVRPSTNDE